MSMRVSGFVRSRWTIVSIVGSLAVVAQFVRIGSDWDWLVAMGAHVRSSGSVPGLVPFAVADTSGWHNVPVLAEVLASVVHDLGERGAVIAHVLVVAATLAVLAHAARAVGAGDGYVAGAIAGLVLGSLATFGVIRAQTFSLLPFALLLALVCSQARRPDRRIWWAVPLVAIWANLHGAALLGVCVLGAYLVVGRLRDRFVETVAVGAASLLALCATWQLWLTPAYYANVFSNVSAQRGDGLWARPSLAMPFDVLMIVAAAVLVIVMLRHPRRPTWEYVAVLGLGLATASAARHGVWLLFLLVVVAGHRAERTEQGSDGPPTRQRDHDGSPAVLPTLTAVVAFAIALPIVLVRGDSVLGAPRAVVDAVTDTAGSGVVLAPSPLAEALAVDGVRLWASNPLDAFSHDDQAAYLDFLDGASGARSAIDGSDVVVTADGSSQAVLMSGEDDFRSEQCGPGWTCFVRR